MDQLSKKTLERQERHFDSPEIGKWYWIKDDSSDAIENKKSFGCVIHVGSNYVLLEGISSLYSTWSLRVHFDEFWASCEYEPDPNSVIDNKVKQFRKQINRLLQDVKEVAARLGVAPSPELTSGTETEALAIRHGEPMPEYKKSLIKGKTEVLPELFKQIKDATKGMGEWMKAQTLPLEAQHNSLGRIVGAVDKRILAVDLYAGLSEDTKQITKGKPAPLTTPLHLMQRRCYMDEECLAQYSTGGMEFKNLGAFDRWLGKKENRNRILPFPRCMVAFRVRRECKEREAVNLGDFFRIAELQDLDKATFLYIRNGNQLWRINTVIDFGEKLFPDYDRQLISSGQKIWARKFVDIEDDLIGDNEYQEMKAKEDKEIAEWEASSEEKPKRRHWKPGRESNDYVPFEKSNVYYDDIAAIISKSIDEYNRIAMIIQGILDRSPILHPHPPWKIWTTEGFNEGIQLVYDESRVLVAGEKPDFEAFRAKLNASLKKGAVTVGQDEAWEIKEAEKESARRDRDWRDRSDHRPSHWCPYGNPGPGTVARVTRYTRTKKCTYAWERERLTFDQWGRKSKTIRTTFTCLASNVLNIDAYKPGDFKQFFNDPRTRIEYLKWAPLLLTAEEYKAGNIKIERGMEE